MITWIQTYFQKHFRTIFTVLLGVIIISFVFTIGAAPGIGHAGHKVLEQPFFGYNLGNSEQAGRIMRDGAFSAQLKGAFDVSGPQVQQYALTRIAGLALADQLHLPAPTEKEVSAFVAKLPVFLDDKGAFDQKRYTQFADALKTNQQFGTADANRVFRDDTRLEAVGKLIGGPGYVLPGDITAQLARADAQWTIAVGSWDYAAFNAGINPTEEQLKKFHDENAFRYEIPARPRLSIVEFKLAEFTPAGAPTEEQLRAYFNANPARFPAPADDKKDAAPALGATAPDHFPKVRAQVEAALRQESAYRNASKAANDFSVALYESKAKANSPELTAFLAAAKRPAAPLAPFTYDAPPADRTWLANYAEPISQLSAERFSSDPLPTPDGYAILLWNESLPSAKPAFAEVRAKVAADYTEQQKRQRFIDQGKALRAKLQAAVKAGQGFEQAAAAEKIEVKTYANFTLRQPPQDLPYQALSALQNLEAGQVAEMTATADKGIFVFAAAKKLPDLTAANPRYNEVRDQLMRFTAASNENAVLSAMVEAELKKSAPATPAP